MIISVQKGAPQEEVEKLLAELTAEGLTYTTSPGENYTVYGMMGDTTKIDEKRLGAYSFVANVQRVSTPYKKASRMFHEKDSVINVGGIPIGGQEKLVVIGGPCSVEGLEHTLTMADHVKSSGACMYRGGAYKPRTSPYAFQGMGTEGVLAMVEARKKTGLPIVSELMSEDRLEEFVEHVDLIQIGTRNMQNFQLLKAVGKCNKPVLLKRGMSNTIEEWIMSAEYIMAGGNENVIFCERGIRTFEKYTRNTLDLSVIPILKERTHLPIIIDPSHATGNFRYIESMSLAAIAAGADGLIVEVHDCPEKAWSDGAQSLIPEKFTAMIEKGRTIAKVVGRDIY